MHDEGFTVTPFDPHGGIWFKYGRRYLDRENQITSFERALGRKLPGDFLGLIGENCEGGFDGHYRVWFKDNVEIQWNHLLLMKVADQHDARQFDTLELIRTRPDLFGNVAGSGLLPFGTANCFWLPDGFSKGYLAFNPGDGDGIVFVPEVGGQPMKIAASFQKMMLASSFVFYG